MSSWHALWSTKKKKKNAQKREGWEVSGGPLVRTHALTAKVLGLIL